MCLYRDRGVVFAKGPRSSVFVRDQCVVSLYGTEV